MLLVLILVVVFSAMIILAAAAILAGSSAVVVIVTLSGMILVEWGIPFMYFSILGIVDRRVSTHDNFVWIAGIIVSAIVTTYLVLRMGIAIFDWGDSSFPGQLGYLTVVLSLCLPAIALWQHLEGDHTKWLANHLDRKERNSTRG